LTNGSPSSPSGDERFALIAEWFDPQAAIVRRYQLLYHTADNTVEMFDLKNRRSFLRRTTVDNLKLADLFIGNTVNVLSRQLTFIDYGDDFTKRRLGQRTERTCALVKPAAFAKAGAILEAAQAAGLSVANLRMGRLDRSEALEFYREHEGKSFLPQLLGSITSGPILAIELMARQEAPTSLRARFGQDATNNAVHGSDSEASAARELGFFFPASGPARVANTSGGGEGCTCGLVKPHAVASGCLGQILSAIAEAGFSINAMAMFRLDKANAEEFLEVYKGVVAEYSSMVAELTSGPCVVLEIGGPGDVYKEFREFCGPADPVSTGGTGASLQTRFGLGQIPEIGRHLRPRTLRARFGKDKVQNAVHCTDLPEDTQLEVQYFFEILDK
uniref:Nucleoside diphosphate kinase n=1 Tax=Macrostomum lignano TaxID=282301 RepID=A0A1I8GTJ9_9PLAT